MQSSTDSISIILSRDDDNEKLDPNLDQHLCLDKANVDSDRIWEN